MDEPDLQDLLRKGIAAAKAAQQAPTPQEPPSASKVRRLGAAKLSQREQARHYLLQAVKLDETNITAWLWLSTVVDTVQEKQLCLENVLTLDPEHKAARAGLLKLDRLARTASTQGGAAPVSPAQPPVERSSPLPRPQKTTHAEPAKAGQMPCPFCGQTVSAMATRCPHCQFPLVMNCPACEAAADIEQKTCPACGYTLGDYQQRLAYFAGLGTAYLQYHRYVEALQAWQTVEMIKPDYPNLHVYLGQAQQGLGRDDRATISLQRALKENPQSVQALYALAELLRLRGEIEAAYSHYLKITQLDPKNGQAWLRLGQLYEQARRSKDAVQAYQRAAKLLKVGSVESQQARQQLRDLQPSLPEGMMTGWSELIRQMSGPVLVCLLAVLLDSGLRPWWIGWSGWLGLLLTLFGAFLWVSAESLPRNPLICQLVGQDGLAETDSRWLLAFFGLLCWLFAFTLIVLPIGQSWPEPPAL